MKNKHMKFYPNRKMVTLFSIFSLLLSAAILAFYSFGLITAIASFIAFGIFIFFIFPVLKNQVVDVKDNYIVLYYFGKRIDLDVGDILEVVNRGRGIISYRFEKGSSRFQISPCSYYNGDVMENLFKDIFKKNKITEP